LIPVRSEVSRGSFLRLNARFLERPVKKLEAKREQISLRILTEYTLVISS